MQVCQQNTENSTALISVDIPISPSFLKSLRETQDKDMKTSTKWNYRYRKKICTNG